MFFRQINVLIKEVTKEVLTSQNFAPKSDNSICTYVRSIKCKLISRNISHVGYVQLYIISHRYPRYLNVETFKLKS